MKFLTMVLWLVVACVGTAGESGEAESVFTIPLARGEEVSVSEVLPEWVELSANRIVDVLAPVHATVVRQRPGALELADEQGNLLVVDGLLAVENAMVVGAHVCAGTPMGLARARWRVGAFEPSANGDPYANPNSALVRVVLRGTVRTLAEAEVYEQVKSVLAKSGEEGHVNAIPALACPFSDAVRLEENNNENEESEVDDAQE